MTWGRVIVKLQNHAAGGISDKDFELARKIEEVDPVEAAGRRARGHPEQVGSAGGSEVGGQRGSEDGGTVNSRAKQLPTAELPTRCPAARPPCAVRHRQARRAGAAAGAEGDAAAVRAGRRGHEDHRGRPDDHALDRPLSRGSRRDRPGADPRALRGGHRGVCGSGSGCGSRRARRTSGRSPATSARRPPLRTTAPTPSRSWPRSTTRPS